MSHQLDTPLPAQSGRLFNDDPYTFPGDGSTVSVMDVTPRPQLQEDHYDRKNPAPTKRRPELIAVVAAAALPGSSPAAGTPPPPLPALPRARRPR